MAKCVRCGRGGMGVLHQAIKLKDGDYICFKCYKELGGSPLKDATDVTKSYSYDEIKDGFEAMEARRMSALFSRANKEEAERLGISTKHVGQLDAAGATDPERRLLGAIYAVLADEGRDPDVLDIVLGDNGSLLVLVGDVVALEYKSDSGVKWIRLPNESEEKIRITGPAKINAMAPRIVKAYDAALA